MQTVTHTNIVGATSFNFNRSENPSSNCALFVNESAVKLSEQSGLAFIKNKVNQIKLIIWFLHRPAFASLGNYTTCTNR